MKRPILSSVLFAICFAAAIATGPAGCASVSIEKRPDGSLLIRRDSVLQNLKGTADYSRAGEDVDVHVQFDSQAKLAESIHELGAAVKEMKAVRP